MIVKFQTFWVSLHCDRHLFKYIMLSRAVEGRNVCYIEKASSKVMQQRHQKKKGSSIKDICVILSVT